MMKVPWLWWTGKAPEKKQWSWPCLSKPDRAVVRTGIRRDVRTVYGAWYDREAEAFDKLQKALSKGTTEIVQIMEPAAEQVVDDLTAFGRMVKREFDDMMESMKGRP